MRDIVKEYQKKFRRNHQRARRYTALLLALALTTSLFVNWQLHGVGIAKTAEYLCGELEHEHTAACYEKQLVCGYEEGEPEDWNATMTDDGMSFDDTIKAKRAGNVVLTSFPAFSVTNLLLVQCSSAVLQCSCGCIRVHPFPLIYAP